MEGIGHNNFIVRSNIVSGTMNNYSKRYYILYIFYCENRNIRGLGTKCKEDAEKRETTG